MGQKFDHLSSLGSVPYLHVTLASYPTLATQCPHLKHVDNSELLYGLNLISDVNTQHSARHTVTSVHFSINVSYLVSCFTSISAYCLGEQCKRHSLKIEFWLSQWTNFSSL